MGKGAEQSPDQDPACCELALVPAPAEYDSQLAPLPGGLEGHSRHVGDRKWRRVSADPKPGDCS